MQNASIRLLRSPLGARFDTTESPGGFKETLEVHSTSTWHSDNIKSASLRAERGEARFLIPFLFQFLLRLPNWYTLLPSTPVYYVNPKFLQALRVLFTQSKVSL